jgi:hypothetical protein
MMRRLSLRQGKPLKPSKPLQRKTPMSSSSAKTLTSGAGVLRVAAVQAKARARDPKPTKLPKPMKSRGMKGRPPTAEESRFMDAIAGLGCVACRKDGWENLDVSVHHIDGRTKPGAHMLVLPLCAGHHQAGTGANPTLIAVHPEKARFEARYGTQRELLAECVARLAGEPQVFV